ncbi:MAG: hypothetical protein EA358_02405 [Flavobacteriales bacterium]|nr:MAG: hypothetical protein EA358_02405 [Flavobacteriales bacterium]
MIYLSYPNVRKLKLTLVLCIFAGTALAQTPGGKVVDMHEDDIWNKNEKLILNNGSKYQGTLLTAERFEHMQIQVAQLQNDQRIRNSMWLWRQRNNAILQMNNIIESKKIVLSNLDDSLGITPSQIVFLSFDRRQNARPMYFESSMVRQIESRYVEQDQLHSLALRHVDIGSTENIGNLLYKSGRYQMQAVNYTLLALGLSLATVISASISPKINDNPSPLFFAAGSLGCVIASYSYTYRSGKYLRRAGELMRNSEL